MKTYHSVYRLAALFWFTLGARTALADKGIAYALITDGTAATVSAEYSLNPGGGAVTATRLDTGRYKVVFPNNGFASGWSVQSTAFGNNANYCNTFQFGGGGIIVTCADSSGMAADSPFSVLAISNTNDKNIAFAYAWQSSAASYTAPTDTSYNPGGAITITRSSVGTYQVLFGGLSGAGGTVQVGAVGAGSCYAGSWGGATFLVNVFCVDTAGNPVDSPFFIDVIPAGVAPTGIAYGFDKVPASSSLTFNTVVEYNPVSIPTAISAEFDHVSTGKYLVTFNGLNALQVKGGNVRATANGSAARCKVTNWQAGNWGTGSPGTGLQAFVNCYNIVGQLVNAEYTLMALPAMGYASAYVYTGSTSGNAVGALNPGGGQVTYTRLGTGSYSVIFPNSGIGAGWVVQATATDASHNCVATSWALSTVYVSCFNSAGVATDSSFRVLAVSNTNDKSIAFARGDQPLTTSYTANADFAYNPAGSVTISRFVGGNYNVFFNGLDGRGSTVQVAATGVGDAFCTTYGWGESTLQASVICYDHSGNPVDSYFTIMVIPAGATPGGIAYGFANQPTAGNYQPAMAYGAAGIYVTRFGVGYYAMSFPGLNPLQLGGGYAQVTTYGTNRCAVFLWGQNVDTSNMDVQVKCSTPAGAAADAEFVVLFIPPVAGPPTSIVVTAGSPQSTLISNPFNHPLQVAVLDALFNPVPNVLVTFFVPTSGASAAFGLGVDWANTDSWGIATSDTLFANSTPGGPYLVNAVVLGVATPATFSLTNVAATSITLQTSPPGLQVSVNGAAWDTAPHIYLLATGENFTIATPNIETNSGTIYYWQSWSDGLDASHTITVPVAATTYTANFSAHMYELTIGASPPAGGTVTPNSGTFYTPAAVVPVTATANSGYSFSSWTGSVANANSASTTVTMNTPQSITANFLPLTSITMQTNPAGLQFSVDGGAAQTAPQTLSLSQGSHTLTVPGVQAGAAGVQYVFIGWNDGSGAPSRGITVGGSAATYTTTFATQYRLTIAASPVAGGTVTPATGTFYDAGTVVPVVATVNSGYTFNGWSGTVGNASNASTTVTMSAPATVTANFLPFTNVTIQTNPAGLQFSVDGAPPQTAPQTLNLSQGSHTLAVVNLQAGGAGTQYMFTGWNDSGAPSHGITVAGAAATYTASFKTQFQLTTAASPGIGGVVSPVTGQFYDSGTSVTVTAAPTPPYVFLAWSGAATGSSNPTSITMTGPRSVSGNFAIPPCQPTGSFGPGVADVQLLINEALGGTSPIHDLNLDGAVDLVDIQIELNAVLGMGCNTR